MKDKKNSACHAPEVGYPGPDAQVNAGAVYTGALPNRFGNRKPPASACAGDSPELYFDESEGGWFGGMFQDGRAAGWALHDPLAEQAQGPYLNPLEQAITNAQVLCVKSGRRNTPAYSSRFGALARSTALKMWVGYTRRLAAPSPPMRAAQK